LFNFCKYEMPNDYKVEAYAQGHNRDKYLIVFRSVTNSQLITLSRVRGFHFIPIENIRHGEDTFGRSLIRENVEVLPDFHVNSNVPTLNFLRVEDQSKIPNELVLKGMKIQDSRRYSLRDSEVLYLSGSFKEIGFFKESHFPWQYLAPIYDFQHKSEGAIAILTNDKLKETIFVVGHPKLGNDFDEETFKKFVDSISFEKDIYEPPPVPGSKSKTKVSF